MLLPQKVFVFMLIDQDEAMVELLKLSHSDQSAIEHILDYLEEVFLPPPAPPAPSLFLLSFLY